MRFILILLLHLIGGKAVLGAIDVSDPKFHEQIKGNLGVALGTIVTIEGEVVQKTGRFGPEPGQLVKVERLNRQALVPPVILEYEPAIRNAEINMRLGSKVELVCFESGGFVGLPKGMFDVVPAVSSVSFVWRSKLMVVKQLK
jgi:hypothetical protein